MIISLLSLFSAIPKACDNSFFGFKAWYYYLQLDSQCNVMNFNVLPVDGRSDLLLILLALVDDLLRLAGLVAIAFIIYGGVLYVTSQGSPDQTQKAQNTIQNSLIGLIVALVAVASVAFIGSKLK